MGSRIPGFIWFVILFLLFLGGALCALKIGDKLSVEVLGGFAAAFGTLAAYAGIIVPFIRRQEKKHTNKGGQ